MKKTALSISVILVSVGLGFFLNSFVAKDHFSDVSKKKKEKQLKLGAFSVSLNVKDLEKSKEFYEKMGFVISGGDQSKNYLVMKNGNTLIGIFQGYFEGNMLTFNPGWDENKKNVKSFQDVREIQKQLKNKSIVLDVEADEKTTGPAYIMLKDPDGNVILMDQHR